MRVISYIFYPFLYLLLICRKTKISFDEKLWSDLVESDIISILFAIAMKNQMMDMTSLRARSTYLDGFTNQIVGLHYVNEG